MLNFAAQQGWVFGIVQQVVLGHELMEFREGEVVIRSLEANHVQLLSLPVVDVDRARCWVLWRLLQEQDTLGHFDPVPCDSLADPEKLLNHAIHVQSGVVDLQLSSAEQAMERHASS